MNEKRSGRFAEVARNDRLARQRNEIEVTKGRATNVWRVTVGVRGEARPFVRLAIEVQILTGDDVERWATVRHHKRIQYELPPRQIHRAEDREAMPDVERAARKL